MILNKLCLNENQQGIIVENKCLIKSHKGLILKQVQRAYHKKRSLSSPAPPPGTQTHTNLVQTYKQECYYKHTNLDENTYILLCESRLEAFLTSGRDICYNHKASYRSRRAMYDDYDLDYTYATDYSYDLEEYYAQDLDEDYARDGQDYESLAYRHYA